MHLKRCVNNFFRDPLGLGLDLFVFIHEIRSLLRKPPSDELNVTGPRDDLAFVSWCLCGSNPPIHAQDPDQADDLLQRVSKSALLTPVISDALH